MGFRLVELSQVWVVVLPVWVEVAGQREERGTEGYLISPTPRSKGSLDSAIGHGPWMSISPKPIIGLGISSLPSPPIGTFQGKWYLLRSQGRTVSPQNPPKKAH